MSKEALLHEYNPWWEKEYIFPETIERKKILLPLKSLISTKDIVMLTGLRRVGKTVTMKCLIRYLIEEKKVNPTHCFYVSMDDYQLKDMSLNEVITEFRKVNKIKVDEKIYAFFDEITYLESFQIQLKNVYDKSKIKVFASSSSSSLLKDDSAHLTGRKRVIEINPLDFNEYLLFKNIKVKTADTPLLETYFKEYMQAGGMPEYVLRGDREYLVGLIDDIIMKDIVAYHKIKNSNIVKDFFILLMERAGKQISINKIANILKISPDTANRYLSMFEKTYLIHLVPRHGKTNETLLSTKKIYATDIGMRNVTVGFRDKGAIFENIVYMKIKNQAPKYVYVNGHEIDFYFNETLLEVKYQRDVVDKQLAVFRTFKAKHKLVIKGFHDLNQLDGAI
jgi:uncharacterized protein